MNTNLLQNVHKASRCDFIAITFFMLLVLQTRAGSGIDTMRAKAEADFQRLLQTPTYNAVTSASTSISEGMPYDTFNNYVYSTATGRIGVWYETRYGYSSQRDLDARRAAGGLNGAIAEGMDWFEGDTPEQKAAYMAKALEEADHLFLKFLSEVKVKVDRRQWNN